jgi:hypothetical protein
MIDRGFVGRFEPPQEMSVDRCQADAVPSRCMLGGGVVRIGSGTCSWLIYTMRKNPNIRKKGQERWKLLNALLVLVREK